MAFINKCADECISEQYQVDIFARPMKTKPANNTVEYFIDIFYPDFGFITVTYNGKVKNNIKNLNIQGFL